jgi:hypothetical protein
MSRLVVTVGFRASSLALLLVVLSAGCGPKDSRTAVLGGQGGDGTGGTGGGGTGGGTGGLPANGGTGGMNTGGATGGAGGTGGRGGTGGGTGGTGGGTGGTGGGTGGLPVDMRPPDMAVVVDAAPDVMEAPAEEVAPPMGLVGHWKLDEGMGTTVKDDSGNMNDGMFAAGGMAPMWTTMGAKPGSAAINFDGNDDLVTLGSMRMIPNSESPKTVALWARWDAAVTDTSRHCFIVFFNQMSATGYHIGFRNMRITVWNYAVTDLVSATAPMPGWHHIAYTFNGTNHVLYIDGMMVGMGTTGTQTGTVAALRLGSATSVGAQPFRGGIDDVRIYNRALTAAEVMSLRMAP